MGDWRKIYGRYEEFLLLESERDLSVANSAKKGGEHRLMNEPWLPPGILANFMDQSIDRCCILPQVYVLSCMVDDNMYQQKIETWPM